MPEGDTVKQAALRLERTLAGQRLTATDFRVPRLATVDLSGGVVTASLARGKHLLTRIDADQQWTLHTHLKMEGAWQVYRAGQRWRRPAHTARVVLTTLDHQAVGFSLGVVELVARDREDDVVGHLGPDLLGPDWDAVEALRRLRADPERPIVEALLDQRLLAGVGNVYAHELCFLAGVHPELPLAEVPALDRMVRRAHQMLLLNVDRVERTLTGDTRRGETTWVYGRRGAPCRRCGTRVRQALRGEPGHERTTYWCPTCQPER